MPKPLKKIIDVELGEIVLPTEDMTKEEVDKLIEALDNKLAEIPEED